MSDSPRVVQVVPANPFRLGILPQDAIGEGGWGQATDTALALLLAGPGLTVLLGPSGVGKTLLLTELERRLRARGRDVTLIRQGQEALAGGEQAVVFALPPDKILLIDEVKAAEGVLLALPGLEQRHCLLSAQPSFEAELLDLADPPAIIRLHPLSPSAAQLFIAERLRRAGRPAAQLTEPALRLLITGTHGIPRLLCAVGGGALYLAGSENAEQVSVEHVTQALEFAGLDAADRAAEPPAGELQAEPEAVASPPIAAGPPAAPKSARPFVVLRDEQLEVPPPRAKRSHIPKWAALFLLIAAASAWLVATKMQDPPRPPQDLAFVPTAPPRPALETEPQPAPQHAASPSAPAEMPSPPASRPLPPPLTTPALAPVPPPAPAGATQVNAASIRLVVSYPRGDAVVAAQAARLARSLVRAGFVVGTPVPAPAFLGGSSLRVFYPQDQPAASLLRDAFGDPSLSVLLAPLGGASSLPRPGTVEISLAGSISLARWTQAIEAGVSIVAPASPPQTALTSPMPTDGSTLAAGPARQVRLTWGPAHEPGTARFVEVQEMGPRGAREIFAGFVEENAAAVDVGGQGAIYAWRVFVVRPDTMHYVHSRWYHFAVEPRPTAVN